MGRRERENDSRAESQSTWERKEYEKKKPKHEPNLLRRRFLIKAIVLDEMHFSTHCKYPHIYLVLLSRAILHWWVLIRISAFTRQITDPDWSSGRSFLGFYKIQNNFLRDSRLLGIPFNISQSAHTALTLTKTGNLSREERSTLTESTELLRMTLLNLVPYGVSVSRG